MGESAQTLMHVIHSMILSSNRSVTELAELAGVADSTLYNAANPADERHRFDVRWLLPLMRACGSTAPLDHLEARLGRRAVVVDVVPDKGLLEELLDDIPALADYHTLLQDAAAQLDDVNAARDALHREIDENFVAWLRRHDSARTATRGE